MHRYRVTNSQTGNQYAITDEDLARFGQTLEQRIATKANAYGENPEVVTEIDTGRIDDLWTQADQLANDIADQNARARFLAWMIDPATPQSAKDLIAQLQAAMDSIWAQYAAGKAAILAGNEPAPIVAPSNLPTFWDVAAAAAQ